MTILILGPATRNERISAFLRGRGHRVQCTEEPVTLASLEDDGVEFLITNGYAPILKPPVTMEYAGRIINIHPSYLPHGRGIGSNFWSFFKGSPKGVSVHLINDGIDTGDVIARRNVIFGENETLRTTNDKLMKAMEELFFETWDDIKSGRAKPIPKNKRDGEGSYHNRRQTENFLQLLPDLWDTPTRGIEELGADIFLSREFWRVVDEDIKSVEKLNDTESNL